MYAEIFGMKSKVNAMKCIILYGSIRNLLSLFNIVPNKSYLVEHNNLAKFKFIVFHL